MSDLTVFSYLTAPNALLYRDVMRVFAAAKRRFTVHLRPEDVHDALAGAHGHEAVADALTRLAVWGNLQADPDTSRVTTVEDFHRARYLYQLSERGEAVEAALTTYDETLGRRGSLQAVALTDIADQLRGLQQLAAQPDPDPAKVHLLLRDLVSRFTDLADNAQAFMGSLQRSIDLHDAEAEAFIAYKDRLIEYLQRFVADLVTTGGEIAGLILSLEAGQVNLLLEVAARRAAEDAAPGSGDGPEDPRRQEFERNLADWLVRWDGFRGWFISRPQHPSQAKLLRTRARASIPQLLQVVSALNERRTGRSDRSADFRTLAVWFAQAPDEPALHRLWLGAFGLNPARHLTIDADTLAERTDHPVPAGVSWSQAPPLQISPRLRITGSYERRGKIHRVIDRAGERRHLAELAERQAAQTAAARAALVTAGAVRLSEFPVLDRDAFGLFLGLLGDALAAREPGRATIVTQTSDGGMEIRLTALDDSGTATMRTPDGEFTGPDHLVEIVDLTHDGLPDDTDDVLPDVLPDVPEPIGALR